jgi:putative ABC transport system permease protein
MHGWLHDLRFGLRTLRRAKAFTIAAVLTIAFGVGTNATLFAVIHSVMLRPLPFPDAGRLVRIFETNLSRGWPQFSASCANVIDWQSEARSFDPLAAARGRSINLTESGEPERIGGTATTSNLFTMLAARPALGRTFGADDERPGAPPVAMITDGLWKRRFASDPAIVGKALILNGVPTTVVGVLPADFSWLAGADIFTPLDLTADQNRGNHTLAVYGRLRPGVSIEQARAEMRTIAKRLEAQYSESNAGWSVRLDSFYDWIVQPELRSALWILLGAVGLLLLVACANVASLLLARAADRKREIAVRVALGAGRGRIVRQVMIETGLVCLAGSIGGLLVGYWGVELLRTLDPGTIPRLSSATVNPATVAYTLVLCALATLLSGVVPALSMSRPEAGESLTESGRGGASHAGRRSLRGPLVAGQIALSLVLLVGAGLLLRSFWRLATVDTGFDPRNLLTVQMNLPQARYKTNPDFLRFFESFIERLRQVPGVHAAAASSILPFEGGGTANEVTIEGRPAEPDGALASSDWRMVTPGFFRMIGVPLRSGRDFTPADSNEGAPPVVIVSETMVRRYWPGVDPIGRRLRPGRSQVWQTVVGVAADVHHLSLDADPNPMVYYPYQGGWNPMSIGVRYDGDVSAIAKDIRNAAHAIDPQLPVGTIRRVDELVARSLGERRFNASLLVVFAGIALLLAAVGLYGAISFAVGRRTREIGVRMALGARPADILRMVLGEGLRLAAVGLGAGLVAAAALTRTMRSLLFGVTTGDPLTFAGITLLLLAVALLATWIPARRAARVDPMRAIRCD